VLRRSCNRTQLGSRLLSAKRSRRRVPYRTGTQHVHAKPQHRCVNECVCQLRGVNTSTPNAIRQLARPKSTRTLLHDHCSTRIWRHAPLPDLSVVHAPTRSKVSASHCGPPKFTQRVLPSVRNVKLEQPLRTRVQSIASIGRSASRKHRVVGERRLKLRHQHCSLSAFMVAPLSVASVYCRSVKHPRGGPNAFRRTFSGQNSHCDKLTRSEVPISIGLC